MTDWAEVYRANVEAVATLAERLTVAQVSLRVPATPDWDVHDLLAHLAGSPADLLSGRMDGAPTDAWAARHVGERYARTVASLVAELRGSVADVVASLDGNDRPALVWNAVVHHADLHEALRRSAPADHFWRPVLEAVAPRALGEYADAVSTVPDYELFRAIFSRRSRSQMTAWGTPLSRHALDAVCLFGPRDDDQPVPPEPGRRNPTGHKRAGHRLPDHKLAVRRRSAAPESAV